MSDKKISELTALTGANTSADDVLAIVDTNAAETKKIRVDELAIAVASSSGLGTMSTQNANNVSITGGSISGITDLAVADGGTGASDASGARTNLGLGTISTQAANNVTISGGTINGTAIGGTTRAAGSFTTLDANGNVVLGDATSDTITATGRFASSLVPSTTSTRDLGTSDLKWRDAYFSGAIVANYIYASNLPAVGSFTWDTATSSPAAAVNVGTTTVTSVHAGMRRCILNDSGVRQYYLSPTDSTKKEDGTSANIDGTDGQVMVEIPRFYTKREVSGTFITWSISAIALPGFTIHPAFIKDGVEVAYRYYSAYDACAFDVSGSAYISGLNRDNAVSNTPNVDVTATTGDKLASVAGIYPMVGLTRAQFRTIAANRGTGWRQLDWTLFSAVQLLFLIEYQSFYSQDILGAGNTAGSYLTQSDDQNQSPHTIAGASNSLGNGSTNTTTGAGVNAKPGTSFMSYRGIENWYGNCNNWVDGVIVNPDGTASAGAGDWWFTNTSADFSDSVRTNMTQITNGAATGSGFIAAIAAVDNFFVATSVSGGSSSTYLTDQHFGSTAADRVVRVGGSALDGADAGTFFVRAANDSSRADRDIGGRLAF
jgi:hypothetical protein